MPPSAGPSAVLWTAAGTQSKRSHNAPLGADPLANERELQGYADRANLFGAAALGATLLSVAGGVTVVVAF